MSKLLKNLIYTFLWLVVGATCLYFVSLNLWHEIQESKNSYYASICGFGLFVSVLPMGFGILSLLTDIENIKRKLKKINTTT